MSIEDASLYVNCEIATLRQQLPKLPAGEYYWTDLEGLNVVNKDGIELI